MPILADSCACLEIRNNNIIAGGYINVCFQIKKAEALMLGTGSMFVKMSPYSKDLFKISQTVF